MESPLLQVMEKSILDSDICLTHEDGSRVFIEIDGPSHYKYNEEKSQYEDSHKTTRRNNSAENILRNEPNSLFIVIRTHEMEKLFEIEKSKDRDFSKKDAFEEIFKQKIALALKKKEGKPSASVKTTEHHPVAEPQRKRVRVD